MKKYLFCAAALTASAGGPNLITQTGKITLVGAQEQAISVSYVKNGSSSNDKIVIGTTEYPLIGRSTMLNGRRLMTGSGKTLADESVFIYQSADDTLAKVKADPAQMAKSFDLDNAPGFACPDASTAFVLFADNLKGSLSGYCIQLE